MDVFDWLVQWFKSYCDGDWEHGEGVVIETLDNPGWSVRISLDGTSFTEKDFAKVEVAHNNDDWILCKVEDYFFKGYGGPDKLKEILEIFKNWVES